MQEIDSVTVTSEYSDKEVFHRKKEYKYNLLNPYWEYMAMCDRLKVILSLVCCSIIVGHFTMEHMEHVFMEQIPVSLRTDFTIKFSAAV